MNFHFKHIEKNIGHKNMTSIQNENTVNKLDRIVLETWLWKPEQYWHIFGRFIFKLMDILSTML